MYATGAKLLGRYLKKNIIFKYGFNLAPMYRRTTGKVKYVSEDLMTINIKIPLSYKNSNYVGSMFGGSMTSATDPIFMVQLINILGDDYVVWDKEATIKFRRPVKETAYANFLFSPEEIEKIKSDVANKDEINVVKEVNITDKTGKVVFAKLIKTIYVADKSHFKKKRNSK
ncbi:MAG: DUF4442 domain-containing protein [Bacteroidetes bacterium]|nr:MAG: DUF4442 domain-containing protein [Bacteroidota bacterium]